MSFRIMPAQRLDLVTESCTRYGFMMQNHPLGISEDSARLVKGDYIASWATRQEAEIASYMLGYDPIYGTPEGYGGVQRVGVCWPQ